MILDEIVIAKGSIYVKGAFLYEETLQIPDEDFLDLQGLVKALILYENFGQIIDFL